MTDQLKSSIVSVLAEDGTIAGAGFLVSEKYVLTCAHVVAQVLNIPHYTSDPPVGKVHINFPLISSKSADKQEMVKGRVTFWRPVSKTLESGSDLALLELENEPPSGCMPGSLVVGDNLWGHPFRAFGFPGGYNNGVWASGVIRDMLANGRVEIEDIKTTGYFVTSGFSGAPVWDDQLEGIVGMIVAAEQWADIRAAFIIPNILLIETCPVLAQSNIKKQKDTNKIKWVLVLSATVDEVDKVKAEALVEHLRKISEDTELTLLKIEAGTVKIYLEGTRKGFKTIDSLFKSGQFNTILGFMVQDVNHISKFNLQPDVARNKKYKQSLTKQKKRIERIEQEVNELVEEVVPEALNRLPRLIEPLTKHEIIIEQDVDELVKAAVSEALNQYHEYTDGFKFRRDLRKEEMEQDIDEIIESLVPKICIELSKLDNIDNIMLLKGDLGKEEMEVKIFKIIKATFHKILTKLLDKREIN